MRALLPITRNQDKEEVMRSIAISIALAMLATPASAYQWTTPDTNWFLQGEEIVNGRLTREAAEFRELRCNGAGENQKSYFVYHYTKRNQYRVAEGGVWRAIGGDIASKTDAINVATAQCKICDGVMLLGVCSGAANPIPGR
jgi:hypothetical protein